MRKIVLLASVLAALASPTMADTSPVPPDGHVATRLQCPATKQALAYAFSKLGEVPAGAGKSLSTPQYDVVLTYNEQKGTFTVLVQKPDGTLCPIIQGGGLVLRSVAA